MLWILKICVIICVISSNRGSVIYTIIMYAVSCHLLYINTEEEILYYNHTRKETRNTLSDILLTGIKHPPGIFRQLKLLKIRSTKTKNIWQSSTIWFYFLWKSFLSSQNIFQSQKITSRNCILAFQEPALLHPGPALIKVCKYFYSNNPNLQSGLFFISKRKVP